MINTLQPYFPYPVRPTGLPAFLEAEADRLPAGTRFAYFRIETFHEFCLDPAAIVASDTDAVRAILADSTALIFDIAHEGPGFLTEFANRLAQFAGRYAIAPRRMIVCHTNEAFLAALRACTPHPNVATNLNYAWYHSYLHDLLLAARKRRLFRLGHRLVDDPAARTVPYLSLNATPRGHRALLAYLIATHPRRDRFVCSFTLGGPKANEAHLEHTLAPLAPRFGLDYAAMQPVLADAARFDRTKLAEVTANNLVRELEPELYARTRVSLVTETEMSAGGVRRTTEKIFKPLLLGHPVIAFANPGTLALLRAMGIDTFDDVLDNSYDTIADPAERFAAAWALAQAHLADDAAFAVDPALRDRLHANVALFEGELLRRFVDRTLGDVNAALAAMA